MSPPFAFELRVEPCDVDEILALRTRVLRPSFAPGQLARYDADPLESTTHICARVLPDQEVIGCATTMLDPFEVMADPYAIRLRGMAVDPERQGLGVGRRVLQAAITHSALTAPLARYFWCNAREVAVAFYLAQGFKIHGDRFEIEGIGPHFIMWTMMPTLLA